MVQYAIPGEVDVVPLVTGAMSMKSKIETASILTIFIVSISILLDTGRNGLTLLFTE